MVVPYRKHMLFWQVLYIVPLLVVLLGTNPSTQFIPSLPSLLAKALNGLIVWSVNLQNGFCW